MVKRNCDKCSKEVERKNLKKIRGEYECKKCNKERLKQRREETIKKAGIKEEIEILDKKIKREAQKKYYSKKKVINEILDKKIKREAQKKYYSKKKVINEIPKIKGSTLGKVKQKNKSSCHITFHEKQNLFRILVRRGVSGKEAKKRISSLIIEQRRVRNKMRNESKSEDKIKIKQQEMLEELWNY